MHSYDLLDHTADMMVKATGADLDECFANAGFALFDQTVDLSNVECVEEVSVEVDEENDEDRLYSFLSELLFIEDCDNLVLKEFEVKTDGTRLVCRARGERLDRSKHRLRTEIKAVTYHMMKVDRDEPSVIVIFDVRVMRMHTGFFAEV